MKAITKKIFIPLIFALLLCLFSVTAFADGETDGNAAVAEVVSLNDLTLTLYENGDLIISGTGPIPDGEYYGHTLLKRFDTEPLVTKVIIEDGVTAIGSYAFQYCSGLNSVEIADSVTSIGDYAFDCCSNLAQITIPNGVISVGIEAFSYCTVLSNVELADSVTSIGSYAFVGCSNLVQITIPNGVNSVGAGTFMNCTSLNSVKLPNSVTSIGKKAFCNCENLKTVVFPEGLTSLDFGAFGATGLTAVTLPDSLTSIDASFYFCTNLQEIRLSQDHPAFFLDDEGVLYTRDKTSLVFAPCSLAGDYEILNGVTKIAYGTFHNCTGLTGIVIPDSITSIGAQAFSECSRLTSVDIPESVQKLESFAFYECNSLTHVSIPAGVSSLYYVFYNCGLLETAGPANSGYNIEYGWEDSIPACAFDTYPNLKSIYIPVGVTSIGICAFYHCQNLTNVYYEGSQSDWDKIQIERGNEPLIGAHIFYAFVVPDPTRTLRLPADLSLIEAEAFANTDAQTIVIPATVGTVDARAFAGCPQLQCLCFEGSPNRIDDSIVTDCGPITVFAAEGSSAKAWASAHGFAFMVK